MADNRTLRQLAAHDVNYNGEDPHRHLKEFQVVCSTPLRPEGMTEDHIKLRAFPFSLQGAAKDWIYYLEPNSIASWTTLKKVFLERYFPVSRVASIRKEICGIRQGNESLTEYWERFKHLVSSCPQHQIIEQLLIQYFYEGLLPMDRNILDALSGGALVDKTPAAAKALIENMSLNSQQFTTRDNSVQSKGVSQIQVSSNKALETRIEELTALVKQLAVAKPQTATLCGICTSPEHPTDTCPILRDESITELPQAYAANLYNQNRYNNTLDLSTNDNHPNWRNHPNLRYGNPQTSQQQNSPQVAAPAPSGPSLEDLVKQMAVNNLQFQQRTDASIQTLNTQMGQLATQINNMQAQGSNQLPAQTIFNLNGPNANVSAISLRSGKLTEPAPEKNKKIIEIPKYAKFLKDLCTNKRRIKGSEKVNLGRNISAFIQPKQSSKQIVGEQNVSALTTQHTGLIIQLANRSNARPAGVVEDVLVEVNDLIFPADFYILDMEGETKEHSVFHIELISELVDDSSSELFTLDFPSLSGFDDIYSCSDCTDTNVCVVYAEIDAALQADTFPTGEVVTNKLVFAVDALAFPAAPSTPSTEQPPSLELKELPENLKYAYLESNEKLPIAITNTVFIYCLIVVVSYLSNRN
ncbi:uncharacterized protein LOC127079284 [Lathyrus oleraceus]|uniref:uncharacterized protein LOC127079284 n=1 Tax=Pisum sativum TaxID=3888 RepID=UPI0021D3406F|nr:uncharacterized protein LOC127079284 [Pisum sativum]